MWLKLDCASFGTSVTMGVTKARIVERLNQPVKVKLSLVSISGDIDPFSAIGKVASLVIYEDTSAANTLCTFTGTFSKFCLSDHSQSRYQYEAEIEDALGAFRYGKTSKIFVKQSLTTIMESLLSGITIDWHLFTGYSMVRDYTAQYNESDLSFLTRMCEQEGMSFFSKRKESSEASTFVAANDSTGFFNLSNDIPYVDSPGMVAGQECVYELTIGRKLAAEKVEIEDFDPYTPDTEFASSEITVDDSETGNRTWGNHRYVGDNFPISTTKTVGTETVEETGLDSSIISYLADVRAEEIRSNAEIAKGRSTVLSFQAGARFTLTGHDRSSANQQYLILKAKHRFEQSEDYALKLAQGDADYQNSFIAVPSANTSPTYRPLRTTPKPKLHGVMRAVIAGVGESIKPSFNEKAQYTVDMNFPDQTNKTSSDIDLPEPYQAPPGKDNDENAGYHFPIRPGVSVVWTALNGDLDRPVIIGTIPSTDNLPPYTDSTDEKVKHGFRTYQENEILFADTWFTDADNTSFVRDADVDRGYVSATNKFTKSDIDTYSKVQIGGDEGEGDERGVSLEYKTEKNEDGTTTPEAEFFIRHGRSNINEHSETNFEAAWGEYDSTGEHEAKGEIKIGDIPSVVDEASNEIPKFGKGIFLESEAAEAQIGIGEGLPYDTKKKKTFDGVRAKAEGGDVFLGEIKDKDDKSTFYGAHITSDDETQFHGELGSSFGAGTDDPSFPNINWSLLGGMVTLMISGAFSAEKIMSSIRNSPIEQEKQKAKDAAFSGVSSAEQVGMLAAMLAPPTSFNSLGPINIFSLGGPLAFFSVFNSMAMGLLSANYGSLAYTSMATLGTATFRSLTGPNVISSIVSPAEAKTVNGNISVRSALSINAGVGKIFKVASSNISLTPVGTTMTSGPNTQVGVNIAGVQMKCLSHVAALDMNQQTGLVINDNSSQITQINGAAISLVPLGVEGMFRSVDEEARQDREENEDNQKAEEDRLEEQQDDLEEDDDNRTRDEEREEKRQKEKEREDNEADREDRKNKREENEDQRNRNEEERKKNNEQRENNEDQRNKNEKERQENEDQRKENEDQRKKNENEREENEQKRENNEKERQQREEERSKREEERKNREESNKENDEQRKKDEEEARKDKEERESDEREKQRDKEQEKEDRKQQEKDAKQRMKDHEEELKDKQQEHRDEDQAKEDQRQKEKDDDQKQRDDKQRADDKEQERKDKEQKQKDDAEKQKDRRDKQEEDRKKREEEDERKKKEDEREKREDERDEKKQKRDEREEERKKRKDRRDQSRQDRQDWVRGGGQ